MRSDGCSVKDRGVGDGGSKSTDEHPLPAAATDDVWGSIQSKRHPFSRRSRTTTKEGGAAHAAPDSGDLSRLGLESPEETYGGTVRETS